MSFSVSADPPPPSPPVRKELHQLLDTLTPAVDVQNPARALRRRRKAPTLFDPQACSASEWRSDGVTEWKFLQEEETRAKKASMELMKATTNGEGGGEGGGGGVGGSGGISGVDSKEGKAAAGDAAKEGIVDKEKKEEAAKDGEKEGGKEGEKSDGKVAAKSDKGAVDQDGGGGGCNGDDDGNGGAVATAATKKGKRGRKKKVRSDEEDGEDGSGSDGRKKKKKRRGRPKKKAKVKGEAGAKKGRRSATSPIPATVSVFVPPPPLTTAALGPTKKPSGAGGRAPPVNCAFCNDDDNVKVCCFCACRVCFNKHAKGHTLLCDGCDAEYHTFCLNPPLKEIPDDEEWFCPVCCGEVAEEEEEEADGEEEVAAEKGMEAEEGKEEVVVAAPPVKVEASVKGLAKSDDRTNEDPATPALPNEAKDKKPALIMKSDDQTPPPPVEAAAAKKEVTKETPKPAANKSPFAGKETSKAAAASTPKQPPSPAAAPAAAHTLAREPSPPPKVATRASTAAAKTPTRASKAASPYARPPSPASVPTSMGSGRTPKAKATAAAAATPRPASSSSSSPASTEPATPSSKKRKTSIGVAAAVAAVTSRGVGALPASAIKPVAQGGGRQSSSSSVSSATFKGPRGTEAKSKAKSKGVMQSRAALKKVDVMKEDELPAPGSASDDGDWYCTHEDETLARVSAKVGCTWSDIATLEENTERYGRRLMANTKFKVGTLLRIPAWAALLPLSPPTPKRKEKRSSPSPAPAPAAAKAVARPAAAEAVSKSLPSTESEKPDDAIVAASSEPSTKPVAKPSPQADFKEDRKPATKAAPSPLVEASKPPGAIPRTLFSSRTPAAQVSPASQPSPAAASAAVPTSPAIPAEAKPVATTKEFLSTKELSITSSRPGAPSEQSASLQQEQEEKLRPSVQQPVPQDSDVASATTSRSGRTVKRSSFFDEIGQGEQHLRSDLRSQGETGKIDAATVQEKDKAAGTTASPTPVVPASSTASKRPPQPPPAPKPTVPESIEAVPKKASALSGIVKEVKSMSAMALPKAPPVAKAVPPVAPKAPAPIAPAASIPKPASSSVHQVTKAPVISTAAASAAVAPPPPVSTLKIVVSAPRPSTFAPKLTPSSLSSPAALVFAGNAPLDAASIAAAAAADAGIPMSPQVKQPRRKPGARECMQISRRFGANVIPQRYMDILLDYCTRGKVEHLIRMRERLDDHSKFLEQQLAGLESLVRQKGELSVTVPPAEPEPERAAEAKLSMAGGAGRAGGGTAGGADDTGGGTASCTGAGSGIGAGGGAGGSTGGSN